jgi:hypothetical protein
MHKQNAVFVNNNNNTNPKWGTTPTAAPQLKNQIW